MRWTGWLLALTVVHDLYTAHREHLSVKHWALPFQMQDIWGSLVLDETSRDLVTTQLFNRKCGGLVREGGRFI